MKYYFYLLLLISLFVLLIFKTQHTVWTEVLIYPYLVNHGFVLYQDLVDPHLPIFVWFLQVIENIFGYSPLVSLYLTLVLGIVNIFLIWQINKNLSGQKIIGLFSSTFYLLWFFYFEGNGLWYELFQTPFIILGYYFLYRYLFPKNSNQSHKQQLLFLGGLFLATSFFIKQSASWVILSVVLWLIIFEFKKLVLTVKSLIIFLFPFLMLFLLISLLYFVQNNFKHFWYWSFLYSYTEFPFAPGHNDYPSLIQIVKLGIPSLVLLPIILAALQKNKQAIFGLFLLGASFMAALPRWGLFHLQPFLALTSLVSIPFCLNFLKKNRKFGNIAFFGVCAVWVIVAGRGLIRFWDKPLRFFEPEMYQIASMIINKGYTNFFTYNGPDQLYVLTNTTPTVKPYVQYFAWFMEKKDLQEKIVDSMKLEKPKFIVFSPFSGRGGYNIGDYRPKIIGDYIDANYHLKEKLTDSIWVLERN